MRVIAGKYRSRRLKTPSSFKVRPTSDRLRETLFNILGPSVEESLFVDLYAGTGAIGIEAISRGAREVFFIDRDPGSISLVRQNLESLQISSGIEVITAEAERGLDKIAARKSSNISTPRTWSPRKVSSSPNTVQSSICPNGSIAWNAPESWNKATPP
jgi:16S rRNA (guanine966-N2)-methyltransferase